ncbi:CYTH domain-containing protein [Candidatus Woesearchaeota archaeon]|nr:CYTH domain-containing protein [Candidatus Woesearchaeota archaeon]
MDIEFEATFSNINKKKIRAKLKEVGAILVKKEFLQRRSVFHFPQGHEINGGWIRIRDESDKITMSLKVVDGDRIQDQKEIYLTVSSFEIAQDILIRLGCTKKAYQESKRELWKLGSVEITIDEWPFLEPFVEIEGKNEAAVKNVTRKLGFDYTKAIFGAVDVLYSKKYNISKNRINNKTPLILFKCKNPFL